jgi:hypothetical protein
MLTAARAKLPLPDTVNPTTNRPRSGINLPAPMRPDESTNAVAVPPPPARPRVRELFHPAETSGAGDDWLMRTNGD